MSIGMVCRKRGMTKVYNEAGHLLPVTVLEVLPNRITQVKTIENDGYEAIQVTFGEKSASKLNKPLAGHYKKSGVSPGEGLWEFRVDLNDLPKFITSQAKSAEGESAEEAQADNSETSDDVPNFLGEEITASLFQAGQKVDVTGTSKGKGFAGVVKRHNFRMQDATHGNSLSHRAHGSTGQCQTPGRVFKGKKMAGQMGNERKTIQNLEVVSVDAQRHLILVKGGVPGANSGNVIIKPAVKHPMPERGE